MKLYDYFRSSAAYRVRIALNLKGLVAEHVFVHLRQGAQHSADFPALNPQGLVPVLAIDDDAVLTQSLAIIEWLEETHPEPPLLPGSAAERARIRAIALAIACDIHPLNNLRVTDYLGSELEQSQSSIDAWRRHWILKGGLEAVERMIAPAPFCFGASPTLADVFLVPQLYSARRFATPLEQLPKILAVEAACAELPAFRAAHPSMQADAE